MHGIVTGWWTFRPGVFGSVSRWVWNLLARPNWGWLYRCGFVYEPIQGRIELDVSENP